MKKLAIAAALLLIVVLVAPGVVGKFLNSAQQAEAIRLTENNPELDLELEVVEERWFSSDYVYGVTYTPPEQQPVDISINVTHYHGPITVGAISSDAATTFGLSSYSWSSDVFKQLAAATASQDPQMSQLLARLPTITGTGDVDLAGNSNFTALIPSTTLNNDTAELSSSDILLSGRATAAGELSQFTVSLDKLSSYTPETQTQFELSALNVDFKSTASLAGMPIGDGNMSVERIMLSSPTLSLDMKSLNSSSTVDIDQQLLAYSTTFEAESLNLNGFDVGKSVVHTNYAGLHTPSLQNLQNHSQTQPPADATEDEKMAFFNQQLETTQASLLELVLHKPSVDTQWDIGVFGDSAKFDLNLNLEALDADTANELRATPMVGLAQVANITAGSFNMTLPPAVVNNGASYYVDLQAAEAAAMGQEMTAEQKAQTVEMMIQMPVMMGYLVDDNGSLKANIELSGGETTLNGQPFPLMQMLSQYAAQLEHQESQQ